MCVIFFLFTQAMAVSEDLYPFKQAEQQQRFQYILSELRCLVCQNQTLMDSEAPLAADLRLDVYRLMQQGKSDQQIMQFLTARYGDFVLYKPPFKQQTYLLWFAPLILLMLGALLFNKIIRHNNK